MKLRGWRAVMSIMCCGLAAFVPCGYGDTEVRAEVKAADYLLPDAASRYYTEADISGMSVKILCYAKNEIYARHGRKFQSRELQEYFSSQPWYYGNTEPSEFSEDVFNSYEKANVKLLTEREFELQSGGYVLDQAGYSFDDVEQYLYGGTAGFNIASGMSVHVSEGMAQVETDYFTVSLPADLEWDYEAIDSGTLVFSYTPAKKAGVGGRFLAITAFDWGDNEYESWPRWQIAGLDADKKYIASLPTDLQYDASDPVQTEEYQRLMNCAERCDQDNESTIFLVKNP